MKSFESRSFLTRKRSIEKPISEPVRRFSSIIPPGRGLSKISSLLNVNQCDYSDCKDPQSIHLHKHFDQGPHLHDKLNSRCNSCTSGFDPNRSHRYYFTDLVTPVRVYLVYSARTSFVFQHPDMSTPINNNNNNAEMRDSQLMRRNSTIFTNTNPLTRQLSRTKLDQLPVSSKFHEEALNMVYNPKSKSFTPLMRD